MRGKLFWKRTFDIFVSLIGILFLSPLLLVLIIAVKIDSPGAAIFKQERIGKNGKIFTMLKLRSMVTDAEKSGAGLFNYEDDPRVTRVGRFLRKTSLDELPQLFNVFVGDMSLVGPRPPVTYELGDFATLNRTFRKRFEVKPGITGLAQIKGRNDIPWDEKVLLDNEYIERFKKHGIFTDIHILWMTIVCVFEQKDIYEVKPDGVEDDIEAASLAEAEIIRKAHMEEEPAEEYSSK